MKRKSAVALLIAAIAGLAIFSGASLAQYPSPVGNVTINAPTVSPAVGSTIVLSCEVLDESGAPIADAPCVFTIVSEPGDDAAVGSKTVTKMTNAQGIATTDLYTGTTAGVIVIGVTADDVSSTLVVDVGGAIPPASPGDIAPPSTGDGGLR